MASIAICGCNQQQKQTGNASSDSINNQNNAANNAAQSSGKQNIIHKVIPVPADFTHLTCISGANVVYTQGDYKMEAVGDSATLQYLETDFDSDLLTISFGSEKNQDINVYEGKINVTINISAPHLQCVSVCSSGDFTSKGIWKGDKIEFGMIGSGHLVCDNIECQSLDYQASGDGNADFTNIKAGKVHIANTAGSNINANVNTDFLQSENLGHSTISFTGQAKSTEFHPTKEGKILFK